MQLNTEKTIEELLAITHKAIDTVEAMRNLPLEQLNWKSNPLVWSILECLEHLNLYGDFYIPEIQNVIAKSKTKKTAYYTPGALGNYFAKSMLPKAGMKKMKTFKDKNPAQAQLSTTVIDRFLEQQAALLVLLEQAKNVNLSKEKTAITLTKLIRLRLGDTLRFVVYHNLRHLHQIETIEQTFFANTIKEKQTAHSNEHTSLA